MKNWWLSFAMVSLVLPAQARTNVWSETPPNSAPLAQVPDFRALAKQTMPAVVDTALTTGGTQETTVCM